MKVGILNNLYSHLFTIPKQLFSKYYFAVYNNTLWENLPLLPGQKIWRTLYVCYTFDVLFWWAVYIMYCTLVQTKPISFRKSKKWSLKIEKNIYFFCVLDTQEHLKTYEFFLYSSSWSQNIATKFIKTGLKSGLKSYIVYKDIIQVYLYSFGMNLSNKSYGNKAQILLKQWMKFWSKSWNIEKKHLAS